MKDLQNLVDRKDIKKFDGWYEIESYKKVRPRLYKFQLQIITEDVKPLIDNQKSTLII